MKKFFAILITALLLTGCATEATIVDREGNEVVVPTKVERIISTAPSNSEVLLGLGLGSKIVGVDNWTSEHPELDTEVTRFDMMNPDIETIIGLEPDIIFASGHNKIGDEDPFKLVKEAGIAVVYIPSSVSLEGIYEDIEFMASLTKTKKEGEAMIDEMKTFVSEIEEIASTITEKKSVYLEISPAPWIYTTGTDTFQDAVINLIGAENAFGDQVSWISASEEVIIAKNPDVIVSTVGGDTIVSDILARDGWDVMDSIQAKLVFQIDANPISRPSQNVIEGIKQLAEAVYPEFYEFE